MRVLGYTARHGIKPSFDAAIAIRPDHYQFRLWLDDDLIAFACTEQLHDARAAVDRTISQFSKRTR